MALGGKVTRLVIILFRKGERKREGVIDESLIYSSFVYISSL